jgi:hypothetical protein
MNEFLQSILDEPWKPVSRPALWAWLVFYAGFMVYAFQANGGFLFIDTANLIVHEGGHNLFRWFGPTLCLWGGTILQWAVPFLLATYFFTQRETAGFVFCLFFFFENWLYTATYMADARAQVLPLVTTGDPEFAEHDFFRIFSSLGVLNYDTKIAAVVRLLGWCGMIVVTVWFARQPACEMQLHADEGNRFLEFLAARQGESGAREHVPGISSLADSHPVVPGPAASAKDPAGQSANLRNFPSSPNPRKS